MSLKTNQEVSSWQVVESKIRCTTFTRNNLALSVTNLNIVRDAMMLLFLCWYDLTSLGGDLPSSAMQIRWINELCKRDVMEVIDCLKAADELLIQSVTHPTTYDRFKRDLRQVFAFAGTFISPLKEKLTEWFLEGSTSAFSDCHTCFVFISRLNLYGLDDLEAKAYSDYIDNEYRLLNSSFTEEEGDLISQWFPRSCQYGLFQDWRPQHGPGSVADCTNALSDKYSHLGTDNLLHYIDCKLGDQVVLPRPRVSFDRCAKVVFVPKSASKLRTICAEPATLQWYQQGFAKAIDRYIRSHRYLRRRIDLTRQELNRDLAWEGSINGSFSTIDLSAASDSVSWQMVKSWVRNSGLREIMWCCRSKWSKLPDEAVIENRKFAPMGSALCFPTECIVFCAITESAIREVGGRPSDSRYRVYGDDIIIETKYVEAVMNRLIRNGFLLNKEKSHYLVGSHNYRESCGGEYLDGDDVTPVRISRKFSGYRVSESNPSAIVACVDLCNRTFVRLPSIRRFLILQLNKLRMSYRVPFNDTGDGALFSTTPTNYHLGPSSYDKGLQMSFHKCGGLSSGKSSHHDDTEDIRLYEYLRVTQDRHRLSFPEDEMLIAVEPPGPSRWTRKRLPDRTIESPNPCDR